MRVVVFLKDNEITLLQHQSAHYKEISVDNFRLKWVPLMSM